MRLEDFIAKVGDEEAAGLFGVKVRTAKAWRLRDRRPRADQAAVIVEATRDHAVGAVTYEGIYAPSGTPRRGKQGLA